MPRACRPTSPGWWRREGIMTKPEQTRLVRRFVEPRIVRAFGYAGAAALALLATAGIARAHLGDGGNPALIHACVATKDGATRIVGPTGVCVTKETPLH